MDDNTIYNFDDLNQAGRSRAIREMQGDLSLDHFDSLREYKNTLTTRGTIKYIKEMNYKFNKNGTNRVRE